MDASDRQAVCNDFAAAARRAVQAGFDMLELHGAGGYLICQCLSAFSNKGRKPEGLALVLDIIQAVQRNLPAGFPLGYRLIVREWVPDGINLNQAMTLARTLEKKGLAYLSPSVGTYNSMFSETARRQMAAPGYLKGDMLALRQAIKLPIIMSGRITTPRLAHELVARDDRWLIGLGRPLRVDPRWPAKASDPQSRVKVKTCINCNSCLKRVVLDQGFICRRWPRYLQEKPA